jgi:hypothetical protein
MYSAMKYLLIIFTLCSSFAAGAQVSKGDTITKSNAHLITTFDTNDIESMITYYFASRIRGDKKWMEVMPDTSLWSRRMWVSVSRHNAWNFTRFVNLGRQRSETMEVVKVYFAIAYNGREDEGVDDVELRWEGTRWVIDVVPN